MICQICKQKEATGHYIQVVGSSKVLELNICDDCAKKMLDSRKRAASFEIPMTPSMASQMSELENIEKVCPSCGTLFTVFIQSGFEGCPACYTAFKDILGRIMDGFSSLPENIETLKGDLERAVVEERFEDAATIRDRLRSMTQRLKKAKNEQAG